MPSWNPKQYLKFEAERARPFTDLVARVATADPTTVVDLGCGPGNVTRTMLDHWSHARILGIDSSPAMINAAQALATDRLSFELGDVATWSPARSSIDVIVSNAALQWVPSHVEALPTWTAALRPGGTLAFQVPAPALPRDIFQAVARSPRWSSRLASVAADPALGREITSIRTPAEYVDILASLGASVDAWETTYIHVLTGEDPVLEWYAGTGLRPYTDALDPDLAAAFRDDVAVALRLEFPPRSYGTLLPFRRFFVVARVD
jgi:trans-aconitate 2-methyltransferase